MVLLVEATPRLMLPRRYCSPFLPFNINFPAVCARARVLNFNGLTHKKKVKNKNNCCKIRKIKQKYGHVPIAGNISISKLGIQLQCYQTDKLYNFGLKSVSNLAKLTSSTNFFEVCLQYFVNLTNSSNLDGRVFAMLPN